MPTKASRNVNKMTVVLLIGITIAVVLQCLVHATPLDDESIMVSGTHGHPVSAPSMLDFACMGAILPTVVLATFLLLVWLNATPLLLQCVSPTFPIFIPPKHTAQ